MTWGEVLDNFDLFALDLQDIGVNVWDRQLMRSMPGAWLRSLIDGLFSRPPLGYTERPVDKDHVQYVPWWPNRAQKRFLGPLYDKPA